MNYFNMNYFSMSPKQSPLSNNRLVDFLSHPCLNKDFLTSTESLKLFLDGFFREAEEIWEFFGTEKGLEADFWSKMPTSKEIRQMLARFRGKNFII